uniref:Uncharacterized protein LOC108047496 n=1 Tax=Drosophila rhopaloa TaxID=1041015 RepID=A0A6P4F756_DRORH
MRNIAGVFLIVTLLVNVQSLKKRSGVNYCTIGVVLMRYRVMCDPLRSLWVLRNGKCKEALHCIDGYSKKECQKNCLKKPKPKLTPKPNPEPNLKPKLKSNPKRKPPKSTPITTCATTVAEIKTSTKQFETSRGIDLSSTKETRRPRRTRRTRVYTIREIC